MFVLCSHSCYIPDTDVEDGRWFCYSNLSCIQHAVLFQPSLWSHVGRQSAGKIQVGCFQFSCSTCISSKNCHLSINIIAPSSTLIPLSPLPPPMTDVIWSHFRTIDDSSLYFSTAIDLYHTAVILSPRRTKSFVFSRPASHWKRGETGKIFCFSIAWYSSMNLERADEKKKPKRIEKLSFVLMARFRKKGIILRIILTNF